MSMVGLRFNALRRAALASTVLVALTSATASADERTYSFNFTQISLSEALRSYAKITGQQIIFTEDLVSGRQAPTLKGAYTAGDALTQLLDNTGLAIERSPSGAIMIRRLAAATASPTMTAQASVSRKEPDAAKDQTTGGDKKAEEERKVERVVVTGTSIRGNRPKSSPVETYTREDLDRMGVTTTEGFVERLPQNFGTRTQYSTGARSDALNRNYDAATSVDLRGLGPGTTLTLLNGRRLSTSDSGQVVDVSMIPFGAIERVEVLTDGASAIYGSDAVGGVVNFILRDDFEGAETRIDFGAASDSNLRQGGFSQLFGQSWDSGRAILSYNMRSASPLLREDRDYAIQAGPGTLTPTTQNQTVFLTLSQDIGDRLTLSGDFGFSERKVKTADTILNPVSSTLDQFETYRSNVERSFINLAAEYEIAERWTASLIASYSASDLDNSRFGDNYNRVPRTTQLLNYDTNSDVLDITGKLDGDLFELPGGVARFSLGGGVLNEGFEGALTATGFASRRDLGRRTTYGFGELFLPVLDETQAAPLARRLEISLAGRYTRFEDVSNPPVNQDFGDAFDPKFGLYWEPLEGLGLRGTYGTSFRAPALTQTDPSGGQVNVRVTTVAGQTARVVTIAGYPESVLRPETAHTHTLGFVIRPPVHDSFTLSGTYYNISYEDRIGVAPTGSILPFVTPELLPDAIFRPTSAAAIQEALGGRPPQLILGATLPGVNLSDPVAVANALFALPNVWLYDRRYRNLALSEQDGFDLSVSDDFETGWGDVSVGSSISRTLSYQQQGSQNSPVLKVVDYTYFPSDLRARAYATLVRGGLSASVNMNYVDDTRQRLTNGSFVEIDSWTTFDANVSYSFEQSGFLNGVRFTLSAINLLDTDPPAVMQQPELLSQIGFDTTNANPLGRVVTLSAVKRW